MKGMNQMGGLNLATFANKLSSIGLDALEKTNVRAHQDDQTAYFELDQWVYEVVSRKDSDISATLIALGIDRAAVLIEIQEAIKRLPKRKGGRPEPSEMLYRAFEAGWTQANLFFGEARLNTGHVLLAMLTDDKLFSQLAGFSSKLASIEPDVLRDRSEELWATSVEQKTHAPDSDEAAIAITGSLERFATDMTAEAEAGKFDKIVGRDTEIRQVIDVLLRRRQNNPILTGEAGVGKTAVVEGFAQRLATGAVPAKLAGTKLFTLDIQAMQAGASMKGEFEQRLKSVIDDVQSSPVPVILFIDEAHTLIGAGGAAGTGDAANLLKPALARGTLRTIAATTWSEYAKYFEKDPALTRRFQPVTVDEPDVETCCFMLRGVMDPMETHHSVRILDEAIVAAVNLSHRYIPSRQLPDKAVSLLDTACARVAVSQASTPARLEDMQVCIATLQAEIASLESERDLGNSHDDRITEAIAERDALSADLETLQSKYDAEKVLVEEIIALQGQEEADALTSKIAELSRIEADDRMVYPYVDTQSVASVISDWTGIPAGRMVQDELEAVLTLAETLQQRVIGQNHGLDTIAKRIETSRAGLANPEKPVGVFMLCGPSGVGKTETALALAEQLYGGQDNVITVNMSEYQEAHTVSLLKGAPPGYVGHGEGGRLTEAVRRKPYSVVLLDEVEKAHPDVHELFFQVFDKGVMEDGNGRRIDFRNTLILLTSNVGTEVIMEMTREGQADVAVEDLQVALKPELLKVFPPALMGRIVSIPYFPLSREILNGITKLKLGSVARRLKSAHDATLTYGNDVIDHIVAQCRDPDSGGRMIDNIITNSILPDLSRELLGRMVDGISIYDVKVKLTNKMELSFDVRVSK
jgi:type VI secretion system protein VasG